MHSSTLFAIRGCNSWSRRALVYKRSRAGRATGGRAPPRGSLQNAVSALELLRVITKNTVTCSPIANAHWYGVGFSGRRGTYMSTTKEHDWTKPAAMAIPKEGYFKKEE